MSLVSEAGSMRSSGFSATRTWPLEKSPSTQARAPIEGDGGAPAAASAGTRPSSRQAVLLIAGDKKRSALSHYENVERELGLDARCDGARGIAAEVRTDLKPPKLPAHPHPHCVLQPGRLATHPLLQRLCVLSR